MKTRKQRPLGVTFFAVIYLWIGWIGAIALLIMAVFGEVPDIQRTLISGFAQPGPLIRIGAWIVLGIWALLYVVCACLGLGLWKLREWSRRAVLALSAFFAILFVLATPFFLKPVILRIPILTGTVLFFGLQFWYLSRPAVRYAFTNAPFEVKAVLSGGFVPPPPRARIPRTRRPWIVGGALAAMALFAGSVMFTVESFFKNSMPYKMSLEEAAHSPCVSSAIGPKLTAGWQTSGQMEESSRKGLANLSIPVYGTIGRGTIELAAEKSAGAWEIKSLILISGSNECSIVPQRPNE